MKHLKSLLLGSTAVILTLGIPAAFAQDKGAGASGGAQVQGGAQSGQGGASVKGGAEAQGGAQMKQDGSQGGVQAQGEGKSRGSAQSERGSTGAKTKSEARGSAETRQSGDSDSRNRATGESGSQRDDSKRDRAKRGGDSRQAEFSSKQQTQVRTYFQKNKVSVEPVKEVNISISVGTAVPSHIHLHPLPATIFVGVPNDREYVYFVYRNDIIVVDADTHQIVYVIPNVA